MNYINIKKKIIYFLDNVEISTLSKEIKVDVFVILKILSSYGFHFVSSDFININLVNYIIKNLSLCNQFEFVRSITLSNVNNQEFIRFPIIVLIGHVNQGKTSLLDFLCKTKFRSSELSSITQKINYSSFSYNNISVIILDTPGHELFSVTRVTSIIISDFIIFLTSFNEIFSKVTINLYNSLLYFNLPIILVINKSENLDKNFDYKNFLLNSCFYDFTLEKKNLLFISVKENIGLNNFKEMIIYNFNKTIFLNSSITYGTILEIDLSSGLVTIILKNGFIKINDYLLCGYSFCKIKFIIFNKSRVKSFHCSLPIQIGFFSGDVQIGLDFIVLNNKKELDEILKLRKLNKKNLQLVNFDNNLCLKKKICFLIKTDSKFLCDIILKLIKSILKDNAFLVNNTVGDFDNNDLTLSFISKSIILLFNINLKKEFKNKLDVKKIKYFYFNNIYNLINYLNSIKIEEKKLVGVAIVKNIFKFKTKLVAGCIITEGKLHISNKISIIRDNKNIFNGEIISIKKNKKQVNEVFLNEEFGIIIKDFVKFQIDDIFNFFM